MVFLKELILIISHYLHLLIGLSFVEFILYPRGEECIIMGDLNRAINVKPLKYAIENHQGM